MGQVSTPTSQDARGRGRREGRRVYKEKGETREVEREFTRKNTVASKN